MDLTGKTLGVYEVKEAIGRGGMAAVYRAHQPSTGRDVAIKVILPAYADHETFSKRFEREAMALATLQHIHILPVFDYGEQAGVRFLVMPLLSGKSLADKLRNERLEVKEASRLFRQMASALDYAHSKGMLHRDIKPGNVLLDDAGNTLLADFGLIRMMNSDDRSRLTSDSSVVGTPAYMSPEQGQGLNLDHRSDLYSLGIMLYEMLTGKVPYRADTPVAVIFKHITEPLPRIRAHRQDLPAAVDDVLTKSLAKNAVDRFQSATAMADALDSALAGNPLAEDQTMDIPLHQAPIPMTPIATRIAAEDHPTAIGAVSPLPVNDAHTARLSVVDKVDKRKRDEVPVSVFWRNISVATALIIGVLAIGYGIWSMPAGSALPPTPAVAMPELVIPANDFITSIIYTADSSQLLVAQEDNQVHSYDAVTGKEAFKLEAHGADVLSVAYAPDNSEMFTGGADNMWYRWEIENHSVAITGFESGPVRDVAYGATLYAYASDADIAWGERTNVRGVNFFKRSPAAANIRSIAISADETFIASGDDGGFLQLWDANKGLVIDSVQESEQSLVSVVFMPASHFVLAGYADGTVILYSTEDGVEETYTTGAGLNALTVNGSGEHFATAHADGAVRIWAVDGGDNLLTYQESASSVNDVAFSPDGIWLAYGGEDKTVWARKLPTE